MSWLSALSALWWALERRPLAFVPDKVQVVDVALVTLVKADLVLCPVVLELPVGGEVTTRCTDLSARRFISRLSPWIMVWWVLKVQYSPILLFQVTVTAFQETQCAHFEEQHPTMSSVLHLRYPTDANPVA